MIELKKLDTSTYHLIQFIWNSRIGKINLQWQKIDQWLPRTGDSLQMEIKFFSGEENILYVDWGGGYMVYTFVKAHWAIYILNGYILLYVNYTSIKLIKRKKILRKGQTKVTTTIAVK